MNAPSVIYATRGSEKDSRFSDQGSLSVEKNALSWLKCHLYFLSLL